MGFAKRGSSKSLGGGLSGAVVLALAARSMVGAGATAGAQVAFGKIFFFAFDSCHFHATLPLLKQHSDILQARSDDKFGGRSACVHVGDACASAYVTSG